LYTTIWVSARDAVTADGLVYNCRWTGRQYCGAYAYSSSSLLLFFAGMRDLWHSSGLQIDSPS